MDKYKTVSVTDFPPRALEFLVQQETGSSTGPALRTIWNTILDACGCIAYVNRAKPNSIVIGTDRLTCADICRWFKNHFSLVWSQLLTKHPSVQEFGNSNPFIQWCNNIIEAGRQKEATKQRNEL